MKNTGSITVRRVTLIMSLIIIVMLTLTVYMFFNINSIQNNIQSANMESVIENLNIVKYVLIFFMIFCPIAAIIIIIMVKNGIKPIKTLTEVFKRILDRDLTAKVKVGGKDEISVLGSIVNSTTDSLTSFIKDIKDVSENVRNENSEFNMAVGQSGNSIKKIVSSIDVINDNLGKQKTTLDNALDAMNEMRKETENIKMHIESQSSAVEQSSASVEEMVGSINSVSNSAEKAENIGKQLEEIAKQGGGRIQTMIMAIQEVQTTSSKIAEAIGGISRIAATTNLLSMNAAIEAAHAGDAGRGFAVVAEEIRKLASVSAEEANKIKLNVRETLDKIENSTKLSEEAGKAFEEIMEDIDETVQIIIQIADAMNEQNTGAKEILDSIAHLVNVSAGIKEAVSKGANEEQKVLGFVNELEQISNEIINTSRNQKSDGNEILKTLDLITDVSNKNKDIIMDLNRKILLYKLSE